MKNYIETNLLENERILYRGSRHWVVFLHTSMWLFLAVIVAFFFSGLSAVEIIFLLLAMWTGVEAAIFYFYSEIAVTNQRVIVKTGWLARDVSEVTHQNISTTLLDQSFLGRLLNYGTVIVLDKSNFRMPFRFINVPLGFRQAIQSQVEAKYASSV